MYLGGKAPCSSLSFFLFLTMGNTLLTVFIYWRILKYLLLALTKKKKKKDKEKEKSGALTPLREEGYMYSYGELGWLHYMQRKILVKPHMA